MEKATMSKQLVFNTESYYYNLDDNDEKVYYEYGDNYDDVTAQYDFDMLLNTLDDEKYRTEARRFAKVKIYPNLGLWDGRHKCETEEEEDFSDAIRRCIRGVESFEIYMAGKWTVYIDAYHHDGTNHFKLTCYK